MKKRVAAAIIIVIASVLCIGIGVSADKVIYPCAKAKAVEYLCDKYDAEKSEFKLVDHRNAGAYWDASKDEFFQHLAWKDFAFEFEYNGKNFYVNRCNGKFFDDYQLDDIELWCTEWLKSNVDKSIIGVQLNDFLVKNYYDENGKNYAETVEQSEAEKIMCGSSFDTNVYYRFDNDSNLTRDEMSAKIRECLAPNESLRAVKSDFDVTRKDYKPDFANWSYGYNNSRQEGIL